MTRHATSTCALVVLVPFLLASCASPGPHLGAPSNVRVLEYGSTEKPAPDYCGGFRPSPRQVAAFLNRSRVLSGFEHNELYAHGPCFARGTVTFGDRDARWEMVLGGKGTVIFNEDFVVLVADPRMQEHPGE